MRRFDLLEPDSLDAACALLADDGDVRPIAGGTALLTIIKQGLWVPRTLVNLYKIKGNREIVYGAQREISIGALASIHEVESSALIRRYCPALAEACHVVANVRIRNMATIGGNLAHADYQSDPPTVLAAFDAVVELVSTRGKRQLKLLDFIRGAHETALEPGELVAAARIASVPPAMRGIYLKFTTGSSEERPCAGVAALLDGENGGCRELRIAVGAVSPKPVRVYAGEAMARNKELDAGLIDRIELLLQLHTHCFSIWRNPEFDRPVVPSYGC